MEGTFEIVFSGNDFLCWVLKALGDDVVDVS